MKHAASTAALALLVTLAPAARAQDLAAAEALFDKGVADLEAGRYATACPAIGESYRLDPRPGTLFTLATCEHRAGRTATAAARFQDYLDLFERLAPEQRQKQRERPVEAAAKKAELAKIVPRLTLSLAPGAPKDAVVRRDDVVLGPAALGVALPIDPGEHVLVAEGGGARVERRITLKNGENAAVALELHAKAAPVSATGAAPQPAAADPGAAMRTAGWVVGGVGLAGLAVGAITGGLTMSKKGPIDEGCRDHVCNQAGKDAADAAQTTGLVSTVGFAVGGAGVVGGAVLLLLAPSKPKPRTTGWSAGLDAVGPAGASFAVRGAF
jgi:hypothetical protein